MDPPAADDEAGWIAQAQIDLTDVGIDKALQTLGTYLALNPDRARELEENWTGPTRTGAGDESAGDREP